MKLAKYYGLASFHPSCRINQIAPNDVPTRMICSEVESAQGLDILNVQSWPFERQHAREKKFLWHFRTWGIMKNLDQAQHEMRHPEVKAQTHRIG